jgi:hypothetical protein
MNRIGDLFGDGPGMCSKSKKNWIHLLWSVAHRILWRIACSPWQSGSFLCLQCICRGVLYGACAPRAFCIRRVTNHQMEEHLCRVKCHVAQNWLSLSQKNNCSELRMDRILRFASCYAARNSTLALLSEHHAQNADERKGHNKNPLWREKCLVGQENCF